MGCVYGFNNHTQGEDSSAEMLLKTVHMIGAALGSKIYVEHAPRRSDLVYVEFLPGGKSDTSKRIRSPLSHRARWRTFATTFRPSCPLNKNGVGLGNINC